jgi:hypothetical protein
MTECRPIGRYAAFKAEGHQPRACREHRTVGSHLAWCFTCNVVVLPGFREGMHPVPEPAEMMATRLLTRPIDEILAIGEDERLCDSTTVDNRVRPFRVISACSKPAEWIYVMKCCGGHALACDPCHEQHLQPPLNQRYCTHCSHPFSNLADGARAVYRV